MYSENSRKIINVSIVVFLALIIFFIYYDLKNIGFVQDDWDVLHPLKFRGIESLLEQVFVPFGKHHYRPIAYIYFTLIYIFFGNNPIGFHIVSEIILLINSIILILISYKILRNKLIAFLIGFFFAVAVNINFKPLAWMVGFYDLGAMLCFLFTIYFFFKDKKVVPIVFFVIGLFVKESIILLPIILLSYELLFRKKVISLDSIYQSFLRLKGFFIVFLLYLILRLAGLESVSFSKDHPYYMEITFHQFYGGLYKYVAWSLNSFATVSRVPFSKDLFSSILILTTIYFIYRIIRKIKSRQKFSKLTENTKQYLFFIIWFVCGLLPVIFLKHLSINYYLIYSFPAFLLVILKFFADSLHKININKILVTGFIIVLISTKIILAKEYVKSIINDKLNDNWNPVSGELVKRYEISKIVKSYLLNKYDSFPVNSVLVFNNLNVWSFDKQYGIQYWYGDQTLKVFDINFLDADSNGIYIKYNPEDQLEAYIMKPQKNRVYIDSSKLYYFKLEGSHLKKYNYQDLLNNINKTN